MHPHAFKRVPYYAVVGHETRHAYNLRDGYAPKHVLSEDGRDWLRASYLPEVPQDTQPDPGDWVLVEMTEDDARGIALERATLLWENPLLDWGDIQYRFQTQDELYAVLVQGLLNEVRVHQAAMLTTQGEAQ